MKVAMLPLNVTDGTDPALGRQFSNFVSEVVRSSTGADVQSVSYLAQVQEEGSTRSSFVNMGTAMTERAFFQPLFKEAGAEKVMHGLLSQTETGFDWHIRVEARDAEEPLLDEQQSFAFEQLFFELHWLATKLAGQAEAILPDSLSERLSMGTDNVQAFLSFLIGYDGLQYVQQSNGNVSKEFQPSNSLQSFLGAYELDPQFQQAFDGIIQLCRVCARYRVGIFQEVEATLRKLASAVPGDYRPLGVLGEVYQEIGHLPAAVDFYEQAIDAHLKLGDSLDSAQMQERAGLHSKLGLAQMNMGMPVNAERNFRKALELESEPRPSLDLLAAVLSQTNRQHEIPALWQTEIERSPTDPRARTRHAMALVQLGRQEEGLKAFEKALEEVEDKSLVKRFYAPLLSQSGDLDRAMDFFEDCLDVSPNDIPLLFEYANTLKAADREFEVPNVLRSVLGSNPDASSKAQAMAWLIEIEQPKRAEAVNEALQKLESGDAMGAVRDLKPLRNWLADYWKLWAILSAAYNQTEMYEEAQDAAHRLLNLFPTYEPGYADMVNALSKLGRNEEAYNVMRHAANNIGSVNVHINLALAAKRAGRDEEARSLARQIREAVGPNEELEGALAEIET